MNKKEKEAQRKQIFWNIVNSLLAGALVLVGSCSTGISLESLGIASAAALAVAITKFSTFWNEEKEEYGRLGSFI